MRLYVIVVFMIVLGACAAKNAPLEPPGSLATRFQSDAAIFQEGYAQLSGYDRPVDHQRAREAFELLTNKYPKSKWRSYASSFLNLMNEINTAREGTEKEKKAGLEMKALLERTQKECHNDHLKAQAELSRIQKENELLRQENEQLKKNIEQLKKLEIELQRRDKILR